jgi:biopolymer transport protein ExbD
MTPMIDVTFLLIIFFLVSSHLAKQEVQLEVELPSAESGKQVNEEQAEARRVTVNVADDGKLFLGAQQVSPVELEERIAFEGRQSGAREALEVRIRCDRMAPYRLIEPIMTACADNGVWKVTFAVTRKDTAADRNHR